MSMHSAFRCICIFCQLLIVNSFWILYNISGLFLEIAIRSMIKFDTIIKVIALLYNAYPAGCRGIQFCELGLFIWIGSGFKKDFSARYCTVWLVNDSLGFSKLHSHYDHKQKVGCECTRQEENFRYLILFQSNWNEIWLVSSFVRNFNWIVWDLPKQKENHRLENPLLFQGSQLTLAGTMK